MSWTVGAVRTINGRDGLLAAVGEELGVSPWRLIEQEDIDAFARVTGDDYWLHTDPERASASSFGGTIAHGLFTLSLGPAFTYSIVEFTGFATTLNYGFDKVRFISPAPVGARIRMRSTLVRVMATNVGAKATLEQSFEIEGRERPVCVAESILQFLDG